MISCISRWISSNQTPDFIDYIVLLLYITKIITPFFGFDISNKCNVGYGFVNMTSPEAAWRLYKAFHRQRWEIFNSHKICQITYARVQVDIDISVLKSLTKV